MIRPATPADAEAIAAIYAPYVRETVISFEEIPPTRDEIAARIERILAAPLPYLVAAQGDEVFGWAYAAPWHARSAYRHSVETSIYLAPERIGQGFGTRLYGTLLDLLKQAGIHAAIGGITLPNAASVALHERLGFQKAAHYTQVGFKQGRWLDVGYWQRLL
jgi:phosphinothricin acetyltransferase